MNQEIKLKSVLSALLQTNHISESKLSSNLSLPRTTINRIITGKTSDPRLSTLEKISNYFNISVDQLLGNEPLNHKKNQNEIKSIPLLKLNELENHGSNNQKPEDLNTKKLKVVGTNLPKNALAIELTDNSMSPQFKVGTILIINPNITPTNRCFVVVKIKQNNCAVFRQYVVEKKQYYLKPINASLFKILKLNKDDKILGVLIQTRHQF